MARLRQTEIHHGLTMSSCVTKSTAALIIVVKLHTIQAAGRITGLRQTLVEISFTMFSNESWRAGASVSPNPIHTLSPVQTARLRGAWLGSTVIYIDFTLYSMCSWWAGTDEVVDEVDTSSTIETGLRVTLIYIILTVDSLKAWFTFAFVRALIVHTSSSIATRVGFAFIDHLFTITACVSRLALTLMGISNIYAAASILAYILHFHTTCGSKVLTGHVGNITVKSGPPHRAVAGPGGSRLRARPAVVAAYLAA